MGIKEVYFLAYSPSSVLLDIERFLTDCSKEVYLSERGKWWGEYILNYEGSVKLKECEIFSYINTLSKKRISIFC